MTVRALPSLRSTHVHSPSARTCSTSAGLHVHVCGLTWHCNLLEAPMLLVPNLWCRTGGAGSAGAALRVVLCSSLVARLLPPLQPALLLLHVCWRCWYHFAAIAATAVVVPAVATARDGEHNEHNEHKACRTVSHTAWPWCCMCGGCAVPRCGRVVRLSFFLCLLLCWNSVPGHRQLLGEPLSSLRPVGARQACGHGHEPARTGQKQGARHVRAR